MKSTFASAQISRGSFLKGLTASAALAMAPRGLRAIGAQTPHRTLGVALVGLGGYSTNHLGPALRLTTRCRLAGVVTGDPAKGQQWARDYGFSAKNVFGYDTMARMADSPDIDVVYVVTPNGLHAMHAIAAARAGKHVICEKPMAVSVSECDAMIAACRTAGVRLSIGYRLRYERHYSEFARLARDRKFGSFTRIDGANGYDMSINDAGWRTVKNLSGGGPIMDMGVYVIQAACMAKVEAVPVAVTAQFGPVNRPQLFKEVDESIVWEMEFADGSRAKCRATYDESVSRFRADAQHGWAELQQPAFSYNDLVLTTSQGPIKLPNINHQVAQLDGMALEILEQKPSIAPGEMGRRDLAIIEAIYDAARSGRRTEISV